MTQHNWKQNIETLKATPGKWILIAELAQGSKAETRLKELGAEVETERVTSKLHNIYARWPLATDEDVDMELPAPDDPDQFLKKAKAFTVHVYNAGVLDATSQERITKDQVYVVWFSKTLQNWKAITSTSISGDGRLFEITHNGDKDETYVDAYTKTSNTVITRLDSAP